MVVNAANHWDSFKISFFDKNDKDRFLDIEVDCKKKNITVIASIENKKKLKDALRKIKAACISLKPRIGWHSLRSHLNFMPVWLVQGLTVTLVGGLAVLFCWRIITDYLWKDGVGEEQRIYMDSENESNLPSADEIAAEGRRAAPWHNEYGGARRSYQRLLHWRDTINSSVRKDWVIIEIERVEKSYPVDVMRINIDNPLFWGYICKPHVNCTQGYENSTGFSAQNVISHLGSNRDLWRERARAACILRNIKTAPDKDFVNKEDLYERLINLMGKKENSLCVAKMALETYKDLTGFRSSGVFDFEGAAKDWQERKEEILKRDF